MPPVSVTSVHPELRPPPGVADEQAVEQQLGCGSRCEEFLQPQRVIADRPEIDQCPSEPVIDTPSGRRSEELRVRELEVERRQVDRDQRRSLPISRPKICSVLEHREGDEVAEAVPGKPL